MDAVSEIAGALPPWALAASLAAGAAVLLLLVLRLVLVQAHRWVDRTDFSVDTALLAGLGGAASLIAACIGVLLYRALLGTLGGASPIDDALLTTITQLLLVAALIVFVDRFATTLLRVQTERSEALRTSRGILLGITRGVIVGIGALVILGTLGISVTPIVASLGITSLAVALALQPTLENFFSGVQLVVDKPVRVGDFVELESGEQGFVERIGWRSTWIRMLPNNMIIMPNSKLAQSKIINYFYPTPELSVPVEVGVHYTSDLDHVERVTLEVAREILNTHEWGVPEYKTFVIFTGFGDSSVELTVMLRAKEYFNRFWVRSAFIKKLHARYAEEGITIPFPIRAVNWTQEAGRGPAPPGGPPPGFLPPGETAPGSDAP